MTASLTDNKKSIQSGDAKSMALLFVEEVAIDTAVSRLIPSPFVYQRAAASPGEPSGIDVAAATTDGLGERAAALAIPHIGSGKNGPTD